MAGDIRIIRLIIPHTIILITGDIIHTGILITEEDVGIAITLIMDMIVIHPGREFPDPSIVVVEVLCMPHLLPIEPAMPYGEVPAVVRQDLIGHPRAMHTALLPPPGLVIPDLDRKVAVVHR